MSLSKLHVKQRMNELFRKEHYHERKRDHLMALKSILDLPNFNQVKECLPNFLPEYSKFIIDECQPCHREQVHEFVLNAFSEQDDKDEIIRFINFDIEQVLPCLSCFLPEHRNVVIEETPSRHRERVENFVINELPLTTCSTYHSMLELVRDRFYVEKTTFSSSQPAETFTYYYLPDDSRLLGIPYTSNNTTEMSNHHRATSCEVNPVEEVSPLMTEYA
eukprot:PhF_6_TR23801/c1_g2_i1/m.33320